MEWLVAAACFGALWFGEFVLRERRRHASTPQFVQSVMHDLRLFLHKMCLASLFPVTVLAFVALSSYLPMPLLGLYRYDWLLVLCLAVQVIMVRLRLESMAEVRIITVFHLLGLGMEIFKVKAGSWAYPEPAWTKLMGVPLYSGFMYASVASFLTQVWHRLRLRLEHWPRLVVVAPLAAAIYLNFFTHHYTADLRWVLIGGVGYAFFRARAVVVNTDKPRTVPLLFGFALFGFVVWLAENAGTFFGAWIYPDQADAWKAVHISKINSWFLLGIISFVLVAELQRRSGGPGAHQIPDALDGVQPVGSKQVAGGEPGDSGNNGQPEAILRPDRHDGQLGPEECGTVGQ